MRRGIWRGGGRWGAGIPAGAVAVIALGILPVAARAAGTPDTAFNGSGTVTTSSAQLLAAGVQSGGDVVVGGQSGGDVFVERISSTGAPEETYTGPPGVVRAIAIEPNDDVVIAGSAGSSLLVTRLTPTLTPDTTFGTGGSTTALPGTSAVGDAIAVGPGGEIAVAGADQPPVSSLVLGAFTASGAPDTTFSGTGFDALPFSGYAVGTGVAFQPDGRIVFVGNQRQGQTTSALVGRANPNGALDTTFAGGAGVVGYAYEAPDGTHSAHTTFNAVALQTNGQIVVGGADALGPSALILRYNSDGSQDTSFGTSGVSALSAGGGPGTIGAYGVGIAGGGRIVAGGNFESGALYPAAWAVGPSGAPATDFDGGSTYTGAANEEGCAEAIAPDGDIVIVGDTVPLANYPVATPCQTGLSNGGFVDELTGYGPAPVATAPTTGTGPPSAPTPTTPTPPATGSGPPPSTGTSTHVGKLSVTLARFVTPALSTLVRRGLRISLTCSQACGVWASLQISASAAKHLHLGRRTVTIATGSGSSPRAGRESLVLRVGPDFAKWLSHVTHLRAILRLAIRPLGGGPIVRITKSLTFRR